MIHNEYTKVGLLPPPLPETYIHTEAFDGADGDGEVAESSRVLVRDTVAYAGLVPGREYTLRGVLHVRGADGSDEGPLLVDGREVTAVKTFFPVASDGSVDVVFEFDASGLAGTTLVAFEELSAKGDPSEPRTLCSLLDFGQRFNAVVFGGLSAVGGDSEGALLVWGDANLGTGYSVGHAVVGDPTPPADAGRDALIVGGDLSMGWQSVNGNIVHGGAYTGADRSNQGCSVRQTAPVTIDGDGNVPMDGTGLARDAMLGNVREAVSRIVGLEVTGTVVAEDAVMTLCGDSMGLNVFEVSASDWSGNGIDRVFEVPAGSKSLVIVRGGSVEIRNGAMRLPEGVGPADVLVVYPDAASITFDSFSHEGSLLAPVASADFLGGAIQGVAIIGGDVAGSRGFEFHNFGFDVFACPYTFFRLRIDQR